MRFIWGGDREKKNTRLIFSINIEKPCDLLTLCAVDFFQIFADGKFVAYGPNRTAGGYSRPYELNVSGVGKLEIKVLAYNSACYSCDLQKPFFGAVLSRRGETVYGSEDFQCYEENCRIENMPFFSSQRGRTEGYDFTEKGRTAISTYAVETPVILDNAVGDTADYAEISFENFGEKEFCGLDEIRKPYWENKPKFRVENGFSLEKDFFDETAVGYYEENFALDRERSGFLKLSIEAEEETKAFFTFNEILIDGKWVFARSSCNELIFVNVPAGKTEFVSAEPYALKYLKAIKKKGVKITPALVAYENSRADFISIDGDERIKKVFFAAKNTFCQNAVDLFTDCPERERAGWLCDSYFMGQAELLFTGKNDIERAFLQNYIIADTPEIPAGMVPKCFPSEHGNELYIPNWAMWFIIEIEDYYSRTGDAELVKNAEKKVLDIIRFFDKYVNEYGLLENLESWVFVDWSVSNDKNYLSGVNTPSNLLFAYALDKAAALYGDETLSERAERIRTETVRLNYNGEFFADNAIRRDGRLIRQDEHISESCQYYALFTGVCPDEKYATVMIREFGPLRQTAYPSIGRSNVFIGNFLRFFWLCDRGEYERVIDEALEYFSRMADKTGTLWEKDNDSASCNHGFASSAAVLLLRCTAGYKGVKNGKVVFDGNMKNNAYGVKILVKGDGNEKTV